jgi:hypothetical protein
MEGCVGGVSVVWMACLAGMMMLGIFFSLSLRIDFGGVITLTSTSTLYMRFIYVKTGSQ